jgi:hypothetical protein
MDENPYKAPQEQGGGAWPHRNLAAVLGAIIVAGYLVGIVLALVLSVLIYVFP